MSLHSPEYFTALSLSYPESNSNQYLALGTFNAKYFASTYRSMGKVFMSNKH
jgi:hypothetical protein